ncbi:hypothetical protein L7F22_033078 [Adiantum nelumboides]|nr:hypothetical protein [Adiantum nelumboides]
MDSVLTHQTGPLVPSDPAEPGHPRARSQGRHGLERAGPASSHPSTGEHSSRDGVEAEEGSREWTRASTLLQNQHLPFKCQVNLEQAMASQGCRNSCATSLLSRRLQAKFSTHRKTQPRRLGRTQPPWLPAPAAERERERRRERNETAQPCQSVLGRLHLVIEPD